MTQKRFIEYRASVNSFPLSEARAGIIPPGRYRGFDTLQQGSGTAIAVEIIHTAIAGIKYTDDDNEKLSDFHGCMVSPHGTVIYLDDALEFTVDANASGSDRYDLVYMEYSWAKTAGGSLATFTLLKGTPGAGAPSVPDDTIDVAVGVIWVPDGASVVADLTWMPANIPDLGGGDIIEQHPQLDERYAIKSLENTFTANNIFQKLVELGYNSAGTITIASHKLVVGKDGNTIILVDTTSVTDYIDGIIPEVGEEFQPGTKLTLLFLISSSSITLKAYNNPNPGFYGPPFTDKLVGTYDILELTYLGEFLGSGSGAVWAVTSPSWAMSKDFYIPTETPITDLSAFPGGGLFTAGAYQPGGHVIGKMKHLYGNITGPSGAVLARESDVTICVLPTVLRPIRAVYVGVTLVSSVRNGHPTTVFRRTAHIAPNGYVTILAGATDDNADLYFDDSAYSGIYLDGISYT